MCEGQVRLPALLEPVSLGQILASCISTCVFASITSFSAGACLCLPASSLCRQHLEWSAAHIASLLRQIRPSLKLEESEPAASPCPGCSALCLVTPHAGPVVYLQVVRGSGSENTSRSDVINAMLLAGMNMCKGILSSCYGKI